MLCTVTLHGASDVPKMDIIGHADPYLVAYYPPRADGASDAPVHRTRTVKSTASPQWEESFDIVQAEGNGSKVQLLLFDEDVVSDELIGSLTIDLLEECSRAMAPLPKSACRIAYSVRRSELAPSAPNPAPHAVPPPPEKALMKRRLVAFFEKYCPERLVQVPSILSLGSDFCERDYFTALYREFNPSPADMRFRPDFSARLTSFYRKYAPQKSSADVAFSVDAMWASESPKFADEEAVWDVLFRKYGTPEPDQLVYYTGRVPCEGVAEQSASPPLPLGWTPNDGVLEKWIKSFAEYDANKSGTISRKELTKLLHERGSHATPAEVKAIVARADANNSGTIEVNEFICSMVGGTVTAEMVHELAQLPPQLLRVTLRSIDRNGDGVLTVKEITHFMRGLGIDASSQLRSKQDHKEKYSFAEFTAFLAGFH